MNRQQRRKLTKQRLSNEDLKVLHDTIAKDVIDDAVTNYSAAMALCLHEKLGFGRDRTIRFMSHVEELFQKINEGHLSLDDVLRTIDEKLKIKFE